MNLLKKFSVESMPKDQTTPGMHSPIGSLKTCVEVGGDPYLYSCQTVTDEILQSILKLCGLSLVDDTFIMPVDLTKRITIAISYELKKTPEKNGAQ